MCIIRYNTWSKNNIFASLCSLNFELKIYIALTKYLNLILEIK